MMEAIDPSDRRGDCVLMTYVHVEQVEDMIKAWQADCADHPAIYNQGNVLRDRLDKLTADIETPITGVDVSAWSVWKGHAIPVDVATYIAGKVNSLLAGAKAVAAWNTRSPDTGMVEAAARVADKEWADAEALAQEHIAGKTDPSGVAFVRIAGRQEAAKNIAVNIRALSQTGERG